MTYRPMDDYRATAIAEGFEGTDDYAEYVAAWQYLHDTGLAYRLQGWFGRTAQRMLADGEIVDRSPEGDYGTGAGSGVATAASRYPMKRSK